MENASKALIIAGAILLSILIISLGIMIFNQAQDAMANGGMSEAEISAFNNKFIKYQGKSQKASVIKNLVQEVNVSNAQEENVNNTRQVKFKSGDIIEQQGTDDKAPYKYLSNKVLNSKLYDVEITGYDGGRVSEISVVEHK